MFITFEGIDGSGKSTQARRVLERLAGEGRDTVLFREPGGSDLSERIRDLLLDPGHTIDPFAEMLLFSAARAQLVTERIRPALDRGVVVLCDRFFDSTTAYQGGGRGIAEPEWLQDFHRHVTGGLVPTRTYLIALPVEAAMTRRQDRAEDRMEQAGLDFQVRVATAYERLALAEPDRFLVVDGLRSETEIHAEIWSDLSHILHAGTGGAGSGTAR